MNESLQDMALIILNYNSAQDTISCTEQLLSFRSNFHIVIVDNMSTDDSMSVIRHRFEQKKEVDLICTNRNGGYSFGNNFGMRYAIEKYGVSVVGILNPDVIIPKLEVLHNMKKILERDPSFAIVGGATLNEEKVFIPRAAWWDIPSPVGIAWGQFLFSRTKDKSMKKYPISENVIQVECVAGCFFLAKASVMQEIGFFDDNIFLYNEEDVLGIKCKNHGYKEVVVLDQYYVHNHKYKKQARMPFRKKITSKKNGFHSRTYIIKKYYSVKLLPLLWLAELLNRIYLTGAYIVNSFRAKK